MTSISFKYKISVMDLLTFLDYFGVSVFAATGALIAARKETDIIGFVLLATVTGVGGGTIRDVVLDLAPVFWVANPEYLLICFMTAVIVFFAAHFISTYQKYLVWADALGLAVFTVVGTRITLDTGAAPEVAVLMGMVTATFGGIIRDVLSGQDSLILKKDIYASAAFLGACSYVSFVYLGIPLYIATWGAIALTFSIRAAAIIYNLRLPGYKWVVGD